MISDTLAAARAALAEYGGPRCGKRHVGVDWPCGRKLGHDGWHKRCAGLPTWVSFVRAALAEHDLLLAERDAYRAQVTDLLARVEAQSGEIYELAREGNRWRALLVRVSEAWAALDENDDLRGHVRHEQVHTAIMVALAAHPQEIP